MPLLTRSGFVPYRGQQPDLTLPISRGLAFLLPFNEGTGKNLRNAIGQRQLGTGVNLAGTWSAADSRLGMALSFDSGADDYIQFPLTGVDFTGPHSALYWVRYEDHITWQFIHTHSQGYNYARMGLTNPAGTNRQILVRFGTSFYGSNIWDSNTWRYRWIQVAYTYDGTAALKFYFNGQPWGTATNTTELTPTSGYFRIGSDSVSLKSAQLGFAGIWLRALQPSEVMSLFREPYAMYSRRRLVAVGGVARHFSATIAAATATADLPVAVKRHFSSAPAAVTQTAAVNLPVTRHLGASVAAISETSQPALVVHRHLSSAIAAESATGDVALGIPRHFAAQPEAVTATSAVLLAIQRHLSAAVVAETATGDVVLSLARHLSATIGAVTDTGALELLVTRHLAALIAAETATGDVHLETSTLGLIIDTAIRSITPAHSFESATEKRQAHSATRRRAIDNK